MNPIKSPLIISFSCAIPLCYASVKSFIITQLLHYQSVTVNFFSILERKPRLLSVEKRNNRYVHDCTEVQKNNKLSDFNTMIKQTCCGIMSAQEGLLQFKQHLTWPKSTLTTQALLHNCPKLSWSMASSILIFQLSLFRVPGPKGH